MNNQKENKLLESNYDGIQEYDNDLPRWWVWLFYFTIVIAPLYTWFFHFGPGEQQEQIVATQMQELSAIKAELAQKAAQAGGGFFAASDAELTTVFADLTKISDGQKVYAEKCAMCHGAKGEGVIGPNLTDKFWIHGGSPSQIRDVVLNGVLDKGMLAWRGVLSDEQIASVSAFVWSIRNNEIAGKAPQGSPLS